MSAGNGGAEDGAVEAGPGRHSLPLARTWVAWMHASASNDWSLASYKAVSVCGSVEELWAAWRAVAGFTRDAMFFFMKEGYPPRWDEPVYAKGGYLSFKVDTASINRCFEEVLCKLAGGSLLVGSAGCDDGLVGASISVKGKIAIVKVWCTDRNIPAAAFDIPRRLRDGARFTAADSKH
jgi:hypothetical protein